MDLNNAAYLDGYAGRPEAPPEEPAARLAYRIHYAKGDTHRRVLRALDRFEEACRCEH